jgi:hypothetical protein
MAIRRLKMDRTPLHDLRAYTWIFPTLLAREGKRGAPSPDDRHVPADPVGRQITLPALFPGHSSKRVSRVMPSSARTSASRAGSKNERLILPRLSWGCPDSLIHQLPAAPRDRPRCWPASRSSPRSAAGCRQTLSEVPGSPALRAREILPVVRRGRIDPKC